MTVTIDIPSLTSGATKLCASLKEDNSLPKKWSEFVDLLQSKVGVDKEALTASVLAEIQNAVAEDFPPDADLSQKDGDGTNATSKADDDADDVAAPPASAVTKETEKTTAETAENECLGTPKKTPAVDESKASNAPSSPKSPTTDTSRKTGSPSKKSPKSPRSPVRLSNADPTVKRLLQFARLHDLEIPDLESETNEKRTEALRKLLQENSLPFTDEEVTDKAVSSLRKRKALARELDGIDQTNIVEGKRRRASRHSMDALLYEGSGSEAEDKDYESEEENDDDGDASGASGGEDDDDGGAASD